MDKDFIFQLCTYVAVFGISDNLLKYLDVSTGKKIILYTVLLILTLKFLRPK